MHSCGFQAECVRFKFEHALCVAETASRTFKTPRSRVPSGEQMAGGRGAPRRAMPYTLPLLVSVGDAAHSVATRASKAQGMGTLHPKLLRVPTLIISTQLG